LIADGEMPSAEYIQKSADEFTGATTRSPTPAVTIRPADRPKPTAPKKPTDKSETEKSN
jgi:hypothetical protein